MNTLERQAVISLASIFGFRMLGLFVLLPVLSIHAQGLQGQTAFLMGMAMGVYGLTQALLQIPFGFFSDRYGRRPLIVVGLLIFFAGSVFAAMAENIYSLILARALQGAGAISAVLLALLADLVREQITDAYVPISDSESLYPIEMRRQKDIPKAAI